MTRSILQRLIGAFCAVAIVAAGCSGGSSSPPRDDAAIAVPLGFGGAPASAQGGPRYLGGNGITITGNSVALTACGTSGHTWVWNGATFACAAAGASDGDYGDITVSGTGTTWTVDSGAVAYSELAGAFSTLNTIPKGDGTTLVASSCTDDGNTMACADSVAWFITAAGTGGAAGNFKLGQDIGVATDVQSGYSITMFGDGNNYIDSKSIAGGSTVYRVGAGAETGFARTWLTVANNDATVTFPSSLVAGTAGNDGYQAEFRGHALTSYFNFGAGDDTYIRGGKAASAVLIGDMNTGGLHLGSASNHTNISGNLIGAGTGAFTGNLSTLGIAGVGIAPAAGAQLYVRDTDGDALIGFDGGGVTNQAYFRMSDAGQYLAFSVGGSTDNDCTMSATGVMNCVGGLQVNGTSVVTTSSVSGTSGRSTRFNGANSVGNGAFFDDGVSIRGATDNNYFSMDTLASPRSGFTKKSGFDPKATYGSASSFVIAQSSAAGIEATNTFTDRFVVGASGNVGVGPDTTPDSLLDVQGTFNADGAAAFGSSVTVAGNVILTQAGDTYIYDSLAGSTGTQQLNIYSAGTGEVRINSNAGGVTNAGTGGLGVYAGANSSTRTHHFEADGDTTLGVDSGDRVGIGIAANANSAMTFAAALGDKIHLYPVSGTNAFGFGIQGSTLQYFVDGTSLANHHSFGYGDSGSFVETTRLDADGQSWFGETVNTDAAIDNTEIMTVGGVTSGVGIVSGTYRTLTATQTATLGSGDDVSFRIGGDFATTASRISCEQCGGPQIYGARGAATFTGRTQSDGATQTAFVAGVVGMATIDNTSGAGSNTIAAGGYFTATANAGGGVYAVYGDGAGYFTGGLTVDGAITSVSGSVQISDSFNVTQSADFDSTLNVDGALSAGADGFEVNASGQTFMGDTANTSIANDLDVLTIDNTGTGQTADRELIDAGHSGSFDTTISPKVNEGIVVILSSTRSAGANTLTNRAARFNASGGQVNIALETTNGDVILGGNTEIRGSTILLGNSATDQVTFSNGPSGINRRDGTHFEWNDEWAYRSINNSGTIGDLYWANFSAGTMNPDILCSDRLGCIQASTSTSASGAVNISTDPQAFDFGQYTSAVFEWIGAFPTLSTAIEEYTGLIGYWDSPSALAQVDGCYFLYDRGSVAADPTTGDTGADAIGGDTWSIWCSSNSTRTGYLLDGTASEDSFTTVNSPIVAGTYYLLKVEMEGTSKARFYINDTEVGRITTNIPSGSTRATGAGFALRKSAGTVARTMTTDFTKLAFDLVAPRP